MDPSEPPSNRPRGAVTQGKGGAAEARGVAPGVLNGSREPDRAAVAAGSARGLTIAAGAGLVAGYAVAGAAPEPSVARGAAAPFPWGPIGAIAVLVLALAFLTAAEAALTSVRRGRVRQLAEEGRPAAVLAQQLLDNAPRLQATLQTGITLATMFAAALAARAPADALALWLREVGTVRAMPWLTRSAVGVSVVALILLVGLVAVLFGEVVPRQIASRYGERLALALTGPVWVLSRVASPLAGVITAISGGVTRLLGGPEPAPAGRLTEEEIKDLVEESEMEGVLEQQETEMIHSVLEFTDIVVREVMVPRIDMVCVEAEGAVSDLLDVVLRSGHTRIPVYEETVDNIVGIVHAKDLLRAVRDGSLEGSVRSAGIVRSVYYVPENMKVDDLLGEFQRTKHQMAIVVDEYGGTAGLVTLEDLIEEIVGPITDEYDVDAEPGITEVDENTLLVDARVPVDDVNEAMGAHLPEEESETMGGLVFSLLGKIPAVGESVEHEGLRIEVIEADSRRVTRVRVTRMPPAADEGEPPASEATD